MNEHLPHSHQVPEATCPPSPPIRAACPDCGAQAPASARFCLACGQPLAGPAPSPSPDDQGPPRDQSPQLTRQRNATPPMAEGPTRATPEPPPEPAVNHCPTCQAQLMKDAVFCHRCGQRVQQPPARFRLLCRGRHHAETSTPLTAEDLFVGTGPECGLVVAHDDFVSRRHLRLFLQDGRPCVEDLNSSNGTLLRLRQPTALAAGDELVIGTTVLRLETTNP